MALQIRPEQTLGFAAAVDIRVVKVVDAVGKRRIHDRINLFFIKLGHSHTTKRNSRGRDAFDIEKFHISFLVSFHLGEKPPSAVTDPSRESNDPHTASFYLFWRKKSRDFSKGIGFVRFLFSENKSPCGQTNALPQGEYLKLSLIRFLYLI
jgi:hypothetical protein